MTTDVPVTPEGVEIISVGDLVTRVKDSLESGFGNIWVEGEISNLSRPSSGHIYLTLKDTVSSVSAVIYRGIALRLRFDARDGMEVIAQGRLSVYVPRGGYQFIVEKLHPKGIGAVELALRQLKEKLFTKGYFDPKRKKPLPAFPLRVALVTSGTGAAVRDMLEVLRKRWPLAEVYVHPVRVQGEGAPEEISAAIRNLNHVHFKHGIKFDAMIVGRGGGSIEDLWAFNAEMVADAIFASKIPVISAVGHEIDLTIADLVADQRALTPSQAVEALVPDSVETLNGLNELGRRMDDGIRYRVEMGKQRLKALSERKALRAPLERIREHERRLDEWNDRLKRAAERGLVKQQDKLASLAARLESLSPLNILSRGYSLTRKSDADELLRDTADVQAGDVIVSRLHRGEIVSRVEEVRSEKATDEN